MDHSFLATILLSPITWILVLLAWCIKYLWSGEKTPPIYRKFDRNRNKPGDFTADGTAKKSDAEDRVRRALERAGYSVMPQATALVVGPEYGEGDKPRKLTPDMIVYAFNGAPCKMIVEYDGAPWHGFEQRGNPDMATVCRDCERNQRFAEVGYTVVRVRAGKNFFDPAPDIDGSLVPTRYAVITPGNDVCIDDDYHDDKFRKQLLNAVSEAQYYPAKFWQRWVDGLFPYVERDRKRKAAEREVEAQMRAQGY